MDENLHPVDELFKQAMEQHNDAPSSAVWDNVSENLDKQKVVSLDVKYKRLKWVAAALLIFGCGMAMYTWQLKADLNHSVVQQKSKPTNITLNKSDEKAGSDKAGQVALQDRSSKSAGASSRNVAIAPASSAQTTNSDVAKAGNTLANDNKEVGDKQLSKVISKLAATTLNKTSKNKRAVSNSDLAIGKRIKREDILMENSLPLNGRTVVDAALKSDNKISNDITTSYALPGFSLEASLAAKSRQTTFPALKAPRLSMHIDPSPKKEFNDLVTSIKKGNKSKYTVAVFFSPDLVFTRLESDHPRFKEDDKHEIKISESTKLSSSFGVSLTRRINNKFSLRLGGSIATITKDIKPRKIFARPDSKGNVSYRISCSSGYAYVTTKAANNPSPGDSITSYSAQHILQYVSLPLAVQYQMNAGRFTFSTSAGVSGNFLSKAKIETTLATASGNEKVIVKNIESLRPFYLNGVVDLGVAYHVNRFMDVNLNPTARLAFSSITKDGPVKTYMNSVGLAIGASFRL
jgi:hypothetical protein